MERTLICLILGMILAVSCAYADDQSLQHDAKPWSGTASIGLVSWADLKDLEPSVSGNFDSLGFVLELTVHKHVSRWGFAEVLAGADIGIFTTGSDILGITEEFTQRGVYITPSVKFGFGDRSKRYLTLEAGFGWYKVDFVELDCRNDDFDNDNLICREIAEPFDRDDFGGHLGISGIFGGHFVMDLKAHFADFGTVTGLGPNAGELKGPIYTFSLGVAFGN